VEIENLSSGGNEAPVEKIEVTFINNLGTGFAERLRIPAGSTVGQLVTATSRTTRSRWAFRGTRRLLRSMTLLRLATPSV
jgi:hypothetical protein